MGGLLGKKVFVWGVVCFSGKVAGGKRRCVVGKEGEPRAGGNQQQPELGLAVI